MGDEERRYRSTEKFICKTKPRANKYLLIECEWWDIHLLIAYSLLFFLSLSCIYYFHFFKMLLSLVDWIMSGFTNGEYIKLYDKIGLL